MAEELLRLSATEMLRHFRDCTVSPVEVIKATIARSEQTGATINAFTHTYFDEALQQASIAEKAYRRGHARPLEGLPVAVKDEANIAGQVTSNGSLLCQDNIADHTDPVPERLLDAGAIVHARTTTPEFSMAVVTWSKLWGITRNPWNHDCSPGGSSGGSGAALAAGTAALATGSDIAGSIRIPASLCGVVGFKPPYGRVPQGPVWNLDPYCHEGPMARSIADCILMENVIAGPHAADPVALRPKLTLPTRFEGIEGVRLAYSLDLGFAEVDEEVKKNTLAALEVFETLGAVVEPVETGWDHRCNDAALAHLGYLTGTLLRRDVAQASALGRLTPYIRRFLEMSSAVSADDVAAGMEYAYEMSSKLGTILQHHVALLCPTMATTFLPADFDFASDIVEINGKQVDPFFGPMLTHPFNILSRCPVLSVPSGRASNNVPTGMQIVGRPYDDVSVFRIGAAFEQAAPACFQTPG